MKIENATTIGLLDCLLSVDDVNVNQNVLYLWFNGGGVITPFSKSWALFGERTHLT